MDRRPVVLGVKACQPKAVLERAVDETRRHATWLRVVHVDGSPTSSCHVIDQVREAIGAASSAVEIELVTRDGDPVDVLVQESTGAELVVVGIDEVSRRHPGARRIAERVALGASCPVEVVPFVRRPGAFGVVVAVDSLASVDADLAVGFLVARQHHEPVHVVHATGTGSGYAERQVAMGHLQDRLDEWQRRFPEVVGEVIVTSASAARAILASASAASYVVLGQPRADRRRVLRGHVMTTVLRHAGCPVLVVPASVGATSVADVPGDVDGSAGPVHGAA